MAQSMVRIGSTGEDVKYLQESLIKLGYSPGPIDGIFGPKTETAVRSFQIARGLVVDGIVGNNTWDAINMTKSIVKIGSTGKTIRYLQESLAKLGYNPGPIDGIFGPKTDTAVRSFQMNKGLVVDGIVGNNTWGAIDKAQSIIRAGSTGEAVRYLQDSLTKLGYNPGPIDGMFGPKTETAVRSFQKAKGLVVDGIVGNNTWADIDKALKLLRTINDYFSFKANTKYTYEGIGNEFASYYVLIDYLDGNRVQLRLNNGGTEIVQVLENKDGKLTMLLSRAECYYRENLTQSPSSNAEILLKEPLIKGTTWTLSDNRKRYISNVEVKVTTPLGIYKTLEVTTKGKNDKTLDYYAPNVGLVKTVFISNGDQVSSSLSKIENNVSLTQSLEFYYPNVDGSILNFVYKQLIFKTNDITRIKIETAYKDLPKGNIIGVLSPNTKIKSLYLNKDNVVYVDFTKELISEMNKGAGFESMILQSITNTLGRYYGVNKVYITVEGKPYASGHIIMQVGEPFIVNITNSVEL